MILPVGKITSAQHFASALHCYMGLVLGTGANEPEQSNRKMDSHFNNFQNQKNEKTKKMKNVNLMIGVSA
jgi:hypothetical protein